MSAETVMVAALLADATVAGLVGTRIAPIGGEAAGGGLPVIGYQRISTVAASHLTGGGTLDRARLQVGCWAATAQGAMALAEAVRAVICPDEGEGIGLFLDMEGPRLDIDTRNWGAVADYFIWQERT